MIQLAAIHPTKQSCPSDLTHPRSITKKLPCYTPTWAYKRDPGKTSPFPGIHQISKKIYFIHHFLLHYKNLLFCINVCTKESRISSRDDKGFLQRGTETLHTWSLCQQTYKASRWISRINLYPSLFLWSGVYTQG